MFAPCFRALVGMTLLVSSTGTCWGDEPATVITLDAREPIPPVLEHALLPPVREQISGNAVVYYGKVKAEQNAFFANQEIQEKIVAWADLPLESLREEDTPIVGSTGSLYQFLRSGARCDHADWQLPIHKGDYFVILLPDIQESRTFSRMLAAKARWEIAHGKYNDAIESIQCGFALARHVADGPTLVQGLVAMSIANQMFQQLETLLAQPDAPNLYWSLRVLPQPLVSVESGLFAEYDAFALHYRQVLLESNLPNDEAWWSEQLVRMDRDRKLLLENIESGEGRADEIEAADRVTMVTRTYPIARHILADANVSEAELEKMPIAKVVVLGSWRRYQEARDQTFRLWGLDYPAYRQFVEANPEADLEPIYPFSRAMFVSIERLQLQRVNHLRCLHRLIAMEAFRAYAATHDGELPKSLEDLAQTPIPDDPATGMPYAYELIEGEAILSGPEVGESRFELRVRIRKE